MPPSADAGSPPASGVRPVVESVALGSARVAEPGVREVRGRRFAMVALRWTGGAPAGVQVRAQRVDGRWGPWLDVEEQDGPDAGRSAGSEPLWVGDSTAVRVRSAETAGLSVVLIDPGTSATDASTTGAGAAAVPQPAVISRAGWGADETIRTDCFARQGIGVDYAATVKAATIHHTAGTNDYTAADSARIVRGIYAYHAIDRDWCDIGYNVLVDRFGQIFEGRFGGLHRPVWGAHAGGFNQYTFGVSMLGTFIDVAPTAEQLEAVSRIVAWKLAGSYRDPNGQVTLVSGGGGTSKYPAGTAVILPRIFAHRDVGNTECPGDVGYQQLPAIRQRVSELMGDWRSSPIYAKWQDTGADAGSLGGVFDLERDAASGGRWASFDGANRTVYWSSASGAHIVMGAILATWDRYSRERGLLGYPVTDELGTPDGVGRFNHFAGSNGSIYWTPSTGAHEVHGAIMSKWSALGWEWSVLGYPITDELPTPDGVGRFNHFASGGSIYWTPSTWAHEVHGAIMSKWSSLGWERSFLGYPVTDELATPDGVGRFNHFAGSNGSIYWTPSTWAHEVHGAIMSKWASLGWERSYLGYPTSDEYTIPGGRRSDFQHGYITWNAATGAVIDRRY